MSDFPTSHSRKVNYIFERHPSHSWMLYIITSCSWVCNKEQKFASFLQLPVSYFQNVFWVDIVLLCPLINYNGLWFHFPFNTHYDQVARSQYYLKNAVEVLDFQSLHTQQWSLQRNLILFYLFCSGIPLLPPQISQNISVYLTNH